MKLSQEKKNNKKKKSNPPSFFILIFNFSLQRDTYLKNNTYEYMVSMKKINKIELKQTVKFINSIYITPHTINYVL